MERIEWEGLPPQARELIHEEIGALVKAEPVPQGRRSALAVIGHTSAGRVFIKGAPAQDGRAVAQLDREAAVAPYIGAIGPALVCDVTAGGWRLLGFEYVAGRRADYTPGSPDLDAVVGAVAALAGVAVPSGLRVQWFEGRWSDYAAAPQHLGRLAGQALLHTDLNPGNVVVGPDGASLVDWGMASLGAALVNPADLVVNLVACGHAPRDAEAVVADLPAWKDADPAVIDYYARLLATTWLEAFWAYTHPWARAVVDAAVRWAMHRRGLRH
ncbi:phosphotransferase [Actinomadura formosensis]|uniref:phosphotransferase n=1 Tax=Actinomadura formosensis TaxID=60706 RepID=UPI003D924A17